MIVRVLVQTAGFLVFMGALLFGSAGGLGWPQVWVFLAIMGVISLATGVWLASYDPGLLQERLAAPWARQQQPRGDRLWVIAIVLVFLAWFIAMGVERRLAGGAGFPTWAQAAGGGLVVLCMLVAWLTFRVNSFAATAIKVQPERGQHVIDTGPYALVRHPMYAGAMLWMIGLPLLLDSAVGLPVGGLLIVMMGVRAVGEERLLEQALDGYADYKRRVRFRLLPGVW